MELAWAWALAWALEQLPPCRPLDRRLLSPVEETQECSWSSPAEEILDHSLPSIVFVIPLIDTPDSITASNVMYLLVLVVHIHLPLTDMQYWTILLSQ